MNYALGLKHRKNVPLSSPRILFLYPPYLRPESLASVANRYCFNTVSIEEQMAKLSQKKNFKEYVESHIRKNKKITREVELAMIETECKSAASKNRGYNFY